MLLENFYKIIHIKEREDGKQEIEIELNPGHVLYQGHFPGQPVVPGVCTLQIIKESAEQIASQPLQYVQIASSKVPVCHQPAENSATTAVYPIRKKRKSTFSSCRQKAFVMEKNLSN